MDSLVVGRGNLLISPCQDKNVGKSDQPCKDDFACRSYANLSHVWMTVWMSGCDLAEWMRSSLCGWDLADWLERLPMLKSEQSWVRSQHTSDTAESEGRQMKQCWIKYIKNLKSPCYEMCQSFHHEDVLIIHCTGHTGKEFYWFYCTVLCTVSLGNKFYEFCS